jgi:hypothetical protein
MLVIAPTISEIWMVLYLLVIRARKATSVEGNASAS